MVFVTASYLSQPVSAQKIFSHVMAMIYHAIHILMATRMPSTDSKHTWVTHSPNTECNAGDGEVYRTQSPGLLANIAECKKSCEDVAACKSITFFESGWCSHFSTGCTKTKPASKAISMRLHSASGSDSGGNPLPKFRSRTS